MNHLSAYTAGIIDCKSSICIRKRKTKRGIFYQPQIEVSSTENIIPDFLLQNYGGSVLTKNRSKYNKNWKDIKIWYLTGTNNIIDFLSKISPFIRAKKDQVNIMLNFCNQRKDILKQPKDKVHYTNYQINLYEKLKLLHTGETK